MNAKLTTRNLNLRRRWSEYQHRLQAAATFDGSDQRRLWVKAVFQARMRESRMSCQFKTVSIAGRVRYVPEVA